jgi:hypothetical protein
MYHQISCLLINMVTYSHQQCANSSSQMLCRLKHVSIILKVMSSPHMQCSRSKSRSHQGKGLHHLSKEAHYHHQCHIINPSPNIHEVVREVKSHNKSSYSPMFIIQAPMYSMKFRGRITNFLQRTISMGASSSIIMLVNQVRPTIMYTRVIRIIKTESQFIEKTT